MENGTNDETIINIPAAHLHLRSPYGEEEKRDYFSKGRRLYKAAISGKWEDVTDIFAQDRNAGRAYITEGSETPLHIAALANNVGFCRELVRHLDPQDLEITNRKGNTALCLAAANGNLDIADVLIGEDRQHLGNIRGPDGTGILPVMMAAKLGNGAMVERLFYSTSSLTEEEYAELLKDFIASDLFDSAKKIVERKPQLAVSDTEVVKLLATKPMAERSKKRIWGIFFGWGMKEEDSPQVKALELLKDILERAFTQNDLNIENIVQIAPELIFAAAKEGNFHLFKWLIDYYPELVWKTNTNQVSMFHVAVQHGHESIFALLHDMDEVRKLVTLYEDRDGNNMLHLAAMSKVNRNTVTGAAFQMQQAIRWYKAVEKIVPPAHRDKKNKNGNTPGDIFDQVHRSLLEEGDKWMKATAKSCMVVATLTATVMFSSAFAVPGGNDNEGHPYLLNRPCFEFLTVSEVIGMLSSSTSILMFLSILTSRFNKYAFHRSFPCKLMTGVIALSVSIASMIIAFCTTIYLSYGHTWVLGLLLLLALACVPIMFLFLKFPLLFDLIHSTFVSLSCFNQSNLSNH